MNDGLEDVIVVVGVTSVLVISTEKEIVRFREWGGLWSEVENGLNDGLVDVVVVMGVTSVLVISMERKIE